VLELDLRCLLFQAGSKSFNFLLLVSGSRLELFALLGDDCFLLCHKGLQLGPGRVHRLYLLLETTGQS